MITICPPMPNAEEREAKNEEFRGELSRLINRYAKENGCNTPDFILANYLFACLTAFDVATNHRTQWFGPAGCDIPVSGYMGNINGPGCDPDTI